MIMTGVVRRSTLNARFLVPHLASSGWALFMDGDMLVAETFARVFEKAGSRNRRSIA
jgi:hypothetical protein